MIQYEMLSTDNRKAMVKTVYFFLILAILLSIGLYFFITKGIPSEMKFGGAIPFLLEKGQENGWISQVWNVHKLGFLFFIVIILAGIVNFLYRSVLALRDLFFNQQAFVIGKVEQKKVQIQSSNSEGEGNSTDRYAISITTPGDFLYRKKIETNDYNNLIEGDEVKLIFAHYSGYTFKTEVLKKVEKPYRTPTNFAQFPENEPLTEADTKRAKSGNCGFYLIFGIIIFLTTIFSTITILFGDELPIYVRVLYWGLIFGLVYISMSMLEGRYQVYKDIKSGYKINILGVVTAKFNQDADGRDFCFITVLHNNKTSNFDIPSQDFDRIRVDDEVCVSALERTGITLGVRY